MSANSKTTMTTMPKVAMWRYQGGALPEISPQAHHLRSPASSRLRYIVFYWLIDIEALSVGKVQADQRENVVMQQVHIATEREARLRAEGEGLRGSMGHWEQSYSTVFNATSRTWPTPLLSSMATAPLPLVFGARRVRIEPPLQPARAWPRSRLRSRMFTTGQRAGILCEKGCVLVWSGGPPTLSSRTPTDC